jgi:hypothetical protein
MQVYVISQSQLVSPVDFHIVLMVGSTYMLLKFVYMNINVEFPHKF